MGRKDPQNLLGKVVADRYRVQDCLGSGTMGAVYRAEHIHMKKTVALKVLHPAHTRDPEVVERFQREAQAAANIEHPNICAATDFGKLDQDFYYLIMEYLEGRPLIDAIKAKEEFGPLRALHIGSQILSALTRAHELGVVHRDLKPENVLLVEREDDPDFVKITDFGVAQVRLFKDAARLTQAGVVYGSPLYMSPEQAAGKEIDHRADLYSVGVMLYELLVGRLPFYAKSLMVVLNMHIADPAPPFREVNPDLDVPPDLEAVVLRLLEKKPDDRYQSADAVLDELLEIQARLDGTAEAASAPETAPQETGMRRVVGGVLLALAALIVLWGAFIVGKAIFSDPKDSMAATAGTSAGEQSGMEFDPQPGGRTQEQRKNFVSQPAVVAAENLLVTDPEAALAAFEHIARENPENAHAQFVLGRAHFSVGQWEQAFQAYGRSIELSPAYASDLALQADIVSRLEDPNDEDARAAEQFLLDHLGDVANPRLAELAEHHKVRKIRKRALRILEDAEQFENLPQWKQLSIRLRHAIGCEENQQWIVKIGEIGDPRALGALRRFSALPKTGCGDDKQEDCYDCLRYDLRVAIDRLESKPFAGGG